VHVRISSPPVKWPCFYGIDFASRAELIANGLAVDEICASIGADSLGYISLGGLTEATTLPAESLCRACFDGHYPIELPAPERIGKHLLEGLESLERGVAASRGSLDPSPDQFETLAPGGGAPDALTRP
jgi:amidophosphoribosyltransferase